MPLFSKSEHALLQLRLHRPSTLIKYSKNGFGILTTEFTRCSWRVLVSEDLVPRAMVKVELQVGDYRGVDLDQLLAAVVRHYLGIGKEHTIKERKPQRLYITCSRGDECAFPINAVLVDAPGLRIIKFQQQIRPCSHSVAATIMASATVDLQQYQDVMHHRWLETELALQRHDLTNDSRLAIDNTSHLRIKKALGKHL